MNKFEKNKKFLRRYLPYLRQLNRLEERLYQIDNRIETTHSPRLTGTPGGGKRHELDDDLSKREELQGRINRLVQESIPIRIEIINAIDHLGNPNQASVLEMFFINDIKIASIAERLHYSFRQANRLYSQGVTNIHVTDRT